MIKTITIDIINDKAMQLLLDLELLQLIRMRKEKKQTTETDWAKRYKGAMSKQPIADIDKQLSQLRSEWE